MKKKKMNEGLWDFVERIEKKLSIKDYLSKYTQVNGNDANCPFHYDKVFSMHLTPGTTMFECYRCGCMGISIINLLMLILRLPFYEVLKKISKEKGIEIPDNIQNEMKLYNNRKK